MPNAYKTSVIIPVYNESATIGLTLSEVMNYAASSPDYYFLFVNDGSMDNTANIIKEKIQGVANIALLTNNENKGKARALKLAIDKVDSEYICFTDGDMAYSFDHLKKLVEALAINDIAIGNRKLVENQKLSSRKRAVAGEIFNRLVRVLLNLDITDTQAGIKGFRKEAAQKLFHLSRINNFAFDAEILYIAKRKAYRIGQIPAKVNELHQFHPSTVRVLRDSPRMFISLLKIIYYGLSGKYDE